MQPLGMLLFQGSPYKVCLILVSLSRIQTPGSAGAALPPRDTLTGQNTSQNLTPMLCTMALGWQNAQGSSQAKKAMGRPCNDPHKVSQVLMELSRCR